VDSLGLDELPDYDYFTIYNFLELSLADTPVVAGLPPGI